MKARKSAAAETRRLVAEALQWSRADEGAEIAWMWVGQEFAGMLQWSRADEGAEISQQVDETIAELAASMEPRR